jgi:DNA polymerase I-like protein with 3'-5' exonuclease and polymerase domains
LNKFFAGLPTLRKVKNMLEREASRTKTVTLPNGRKLYCPYPHTAYNTLLQGLGAEISKYWICNTIDNGLYEFAQPVVYVHDELQSECVPEKADEASEILHASIAQVKEQLGTEINFTIDVKTGKSWRETH